jgi:hypothetical protein
VYDLGGGQKNLLTFFAKSGILYKWASQYREIWTISRYVWRIAICASPIIVGYGPHSCSMLTNEVHRSVEDEFFISLSSRFPSIFFLMVFEESHSASMARSLKMSLPILPPRPALSDYFGSIAQSDGYSNAAPVLVLPSSAFSVPGSRRCRELNEPASVVLSHQEGLL